MKYYKIQFEHSDFVRAWQDKGFSYEGDVMVKKESVNTLSGESSTPLNVIVKTDMVKKIEVPDTNAITGVVYELTDTSFPKQVLTKIEEVCIGEGLKLIRSGFDKLRAEIIEPEWNEIGRWSVNTRIPVPEALLVKLRSFEGDIEFSGCVFGNVSSALFITPDNKITFETEEICSVAIRKLVGEVLSKVLK